MKSVYLYLAAPLSASFALIWPKNLFLQIWPREMVLLMPRHCSLDMILFDKMPIGFVSAAGATWVSSYANDVSVIDDTGTTLYAVAEEFTKMMS